MPTHGTNPAPERDCGKQTRDNNHVISPDLAFPAGISWLFWRQSSRNEPSSHFVSCIEASHTQTPPPPTPLLPGFCRMPTQRSPTFLRSFSETWTSSPRTSSRGWFSCGSGSGPSATLCWMRWENLGISPSQLLWGFPGKQLHGSAHLISGLFWFAEVGKKNNGNFSGFS